MPKVKWIGGNAEAAPPPVVEAKPSVNYLQGLFAAYRLANGLTSEEVGKRLGCSGEYVRYQWRKKPDDWNLGALRRMCAAMGIPFAEALDAARK